MSLIQHPVSRELAASLVGSTLLSALSDFATPKDSESIVVAGVTKPHVVLAAAMILAVADSKNPVDALENVLTFASSALACIEGQSVESVVGAATMGWFAARHEGEPAGAAKAFLDWAMVAADQNSATALDLETVESSPEDTAPIFSLFGGQSDFLEAAGGLIHACEDEEQVVVELQVGGVVKTTGDDCWDPLTRQVGESMSCMSQSELDLPPTAAPELPPTAAPELPPTAAPELPPTAAPELPPTAAPELPPTAAPTVSAVLPESLYVSGPLGSAVSRFR